MSQTMLPLTRPIALPSSAIIGEPDIPEVICPLTAVNEIRLVSREYSTRSLTQSPASDTASAACPLSGGGEMVSGSIGPLWGILTLGLARRLLLSPSSQKIF